MGGVDLNLVRVHSVLRCPVPSAMGNMAVEGDLEETGPQETEVQVCFYLVPAKPLPKGGCRLREATS